MSKTLIITANYMRFAKNFGMWYISKEQLLLSILMLSQRIWVKIYAEFKEADHYSNEQFSRDSSFTCCWPFSWIWIQEFRNSCTEKISSGKLIVFSIYCSSFTCSVISIAVCVLWWGYCRTIEMCSWTDPNIEILWHSVQFRKCFR